MIDFDELFQLLSDYFDEDLEAQLCAEIDQMFNEELWFHSFFNTFHRTIDLCYELESEEIEVPQETHIQLFEVLRIEMAKQLTGSVESLPDRPRRSRPEPMTGSRARRLPKRRPRK